MKIVVDASVAASAGKSPGRSILCTQVLDTIINSSLGVHICPKMDSEWFTHASRYSRSWLVAMKLKRRLFFDAVPARDDIRRVVDNLNPSDGKKQSLEKDLHLVEAAFHCNNRLVSCDSRARREFSSISGQCPDLNDLFWAHVDENARAKEAIHWLSLGAPENESLKLAYSC